MIWNIALLFLVFGASKKKFNPYASAAILGAVKAVLYYIGSSSIIAAVLGLLIFGGLAAAMVYFLARLDNKEATEEPYPKYGAGKKSGPFKWEYIPLSTIVILLIGGEMLAAML
jgi:heme/copper-type cytochrome/quinol oxidase subunit 2